MQVKENTIEYWWEYFVARHGFDGTLEEAKILCVLAHENYMRYAAENPES